MFIRAIKSQRRLKIHFLVEAAKLGAASYVVGFVLAGILHFGIVRSFGIFDAETGLLDFALFMVTVLICLYLAGALLAAIYYGRKLQRGHLSREEYINIAVKGIYPKHWQNSEVTEVPVGLKRAMYIFAVTMVLLALATQLVGQKRIALLMFQIKNGSTFEFEDKKYEVNGFVIARTFPETGRVALSALAIYPNVIYLRPFASSELQEALEIGTFSLVKTLTGPCELYTVNLNEMAGARLLANHDLEFFYPLDHNHLSTINLEELCTAVSVVEG